MRKENTCRWRRKKASLPGIAVIAAASAVLGLLLYPTWASSVDIPPAAEKKTVVLKQGYLETGRIFVAKCGQCHKTPDPATSLETRADCSRSLSQNDLSAAQKYMADVRAGKSLYESHCGRCHDLITPESHTPDYWSKNLCTSDECFVKKLREDEEQQLLLYLSSHAKKN